MANQERTESKYAKKRAQRFSQGGRINKSLGDGQIERVGAEKAVNPMPRPLDPEYFPKHTPKYSVQPNHTPMKHEDIKMLARIQNKDFVYPKPKWKRREVTIKYDHYAMNYTGWNS